MGRKLAYTVVVRQTKPIDKDRPEKGITVVREETFLAGADLPDWAAKCVGDHVYGDNADEPAAEPAESAGDEPATENA